VRFCLIILVGQAYYQRETTGAYLGVGVDFDLTVNIKLALKFFIEANALAYHSMDEVKKI